MIAAIIAFMAGAVFHILDRIEQHNAAMLGKIDDSVGDVYDAGARAKARQMELATRTAPLASVSRLAPPR
jgi:hypothetical protein